MSNNVTVLVDTEVDLGVADEVIADCRARLANLTADTPEGYEAVKAGLSELVSLRTGVERSRKELKAGALEYGRKVDRAAKDATAKILEIEAPLKQRKLAVDNAEALRLKAIEDAKQAKIEAEERAERERIAKEQEEERERFRKEQEELLAERKAFEDKQAAFQAQQEQLAAERQAVEDAKAEVEAARLKAIEDARLAEEAAAEQKRLEEEEAARALAAQKEAEKEAKRLLAEEKKRKAEHKRLLKERKPDIEALKGFATMIAAVPRPCLETEWGREVLSNADEVLIDCVYRIAEVIK